MSRLTHEHLSRLAIQHLDPATATSWTALLRPAVQLRAARPGDPVVARLGGTPQLPDDQAWPDWPGVGPLTCAAEVDLQLLATLGLRTGLPLPREGRLLAFCFDDGEVLERLDVVAHPSDPATRPASRLLLAPPGAPAAQPLRELTGVQVTTWPDREHPALTALGIEQLPDDLDEAIDELLEEEHPDEEPYHRLGGWAQPLQSSVEYEAAESRLAATYDEAHDAEALRWRPLLQVDADASVGTSWSDLGCLYWLGRDVSDRWPGDDDIAYVHQI